MEGIERSQTVTHLSYILPAVESIHCVEEEGVWRVRLAFLVNLMAGRGEHKESK